MSAAIALAEAYPFEQPTAEVFAWVQGRAIAAADMPRRGHAVLAAGSNASPQQLRRKFGDRAKPVLVEAVTLAGHAIVYSAHFARYGSIPATLTACPDAETRAYVTWLDDDDLQQMHLSEALGVNYDYEPADKFHVIDRDGQVLPVDGYYATRRGLLRLQDRPIRLAAMTTSGSVWPALTQRAVLGAVARRLMPKMAYDDFMSRIIEDADFRQCCSERLRRLA